MEKWYKRNQRVQLFYQVLSSVGSTAESGLTTVSPRLNLNFNESSGNELLSDILVLPQPKERGATRRGVNHDAVCITEPEFVEQMKSKEL